MPSNKSSSADNQQERLKTIGWIVGYIDGEGCFSVSLNHNHTTKIGWQVFPEFVVTQGAKSLSTLHLLKQFFRCGNIFVNRRRDNHRENLYRYCVRSRKDLVEKIVPFFCQHQLKTAKKNDFQHFIAILKLMAKNEHLTFQGIKRIAAIVGKMNRKQESRFLKSSETIRQTSLKARKI